jgi:hypothetical protein
MQTIAEKFTEETLTAIFPAERSDAFFDALFGDAEEGAYDIRLVFKGLGSEGKTLLFELELHERPGKCLACNLTHGLPEVFSRHPVINIKGIVQEIDRLLGDSASCAGWKLGTTRSVSRNLHTIPLTVSIG